MCNFLSAIVTRQGEIFCNPLLDSHEDLIDLFQLKDNRMDHFVRVEFSPVEKINLDKIEKYIFRVDEESTPKWFDEELKDKTICKLKDILKKIIITENRKILVDGAYILSGCKIEKITECRVVALCGGTVNEICGGTVNAIWGGTVNKIRGGTVNEILGGTVNEIRGGTVNAIWGGTVNEICGGTVIKDFRVKK